LDNSLDEPSSSNNSQSLEKNIHFTQHTHVLPPRLHPITAVWLTNPNALHHVVAVESFRADVTLEKARKSESEKQMATQLLKDQLFKEQTSKESKEKRKIARDKLAAERNQQKRPVSQTGSNYFSYDYSSLDIQTIPSDSDEEDREDAQEVARLCGKVDDNIREERIEIQRLRQHGFYDLNSLASSLKEAEQKKKRQAKKQQAKRVRIRATPEIRVATPADYDDAIEENKRTRKPSDQGRNRKVSAERKAARKTQR
jgi:hypothetical protein